MKKTLPIIAMTLCLAAVRAQEGYRSFFGQEQTSWNIAAMNYDDPNYGNWTIFIQGDTLVDGTVYKKANLSRSEETDIFQGMIREDTLTGRMWLRGFVYSSATEFLIADMSLEVGDFFEGIPVQRVFVDNMGRKVVTIGDTYESFSFIEGVGTSMFPIRITPFGARDFLICAFHDDARTWQAEGLDTAEFDMENCRAKYLDIGIRQPELPAFSVHPNPCGDFIRIDAEPSARGVALYDCTGRQVRTWDNLGIPLNISALNDGIYFLRLVSSYNATFIKLIKKHTP